MPKAINWKGPFPFTLSAVLSLRVWAMELDMEGTVSRLQDIADAAVCDFTFSEEVLIEIDKIKSRIHKAHKKQEFTRKVEKAQDELRILRSQLYELEG